MLVVIARQFQPRWLGATGDHFQPHYRMPFALMSGRQDGLFLIDLAASHCPLILWLRAAPPANYANVGGCGIQNGNASSNHTSSASKSQLQRNSTTHVGPVPAKYTKHAPFSRYLLRKPDSREQTARQ